MPKNTQVPKIRGLFPMPALCLALGLAACSGNSPPSPSIVNGTEVSDPNADAGSIDQTDSGLISTATLNNSGFQDVIPLLEARASITVSDEFSYIVDHALSPDGSGLAIAISENRIFDPPPNPQGDRIEIYNTETGLLVQTLGYPGIHDIFGHLFWSTSNQIHWFYDSFLTESTNTEHWVTWDVNTAAVVQKQSVVPEQPCENWSGMFFDAFHSTLDTVIFLEKNDENTQPHLCRINLSDSSSSSAVINFPVIGSPLISSDGSITAVKQANSPEATSFIAQTNTYDTSSLSYRDEVYDNEGFPQLLGSGYRLVQYGSAYLYLLPSNERLDMGIRVVYVAESGKMLSAKNPESNEYVRFVTLPDGIVVGDVEESISNGAHSRRISRDGDVAIITTRQSDQDSYRFDAFSLSSRTSYTALTQ